MKELQDIHLLIGGLSDEQIRLLSGFAGKLEIPYVIPFTSTSNEPLTNYNVYQVNTTQSFLYSKTSLAFFNKFKNANVLFFDSGTNANKADLTTIMKTDLSAKKIPYQIVRTENDLLSAFSNATSPYRNYVIVPSDDSKLTLIKLIEILKIAKEKHPEASVSMFGHPAWQTYAAEYSSDFFRLNATIYTVFYADPTSAEVKSFISRYHRWYARDLINIFPKYGMLGYDTGMFFIQLLNRYGNAIDANVNRLQYKGIQTDFHFDRINNWGGFINVNIYFVEFGKDLKINIKRIE
jgi:hypothetical protein